uniref:Uncharacterized protein n=1 Tax=mine drainage metagenome TaxID=410659 RepID=E6QQZ3_9ZZZZ
MLKLPLSLLYPRSSGLLASDWLVRILKINMMKNLLILLMSFPLRSHFSCCMRGLDLHCIGG